MTAFQLLVKQTEYEVKTLEMIILMKQKGKSVNEIVEAVGVTSSEVRQCNDTKLKRAKQRLFQYKGGRF